MISLFARLVESGLSTTDDSDIRLKKVALTLVPLIIGPAAFLWGTIYSFLGHPLSGSIPMFYFFISAFSLIYFFKTKRMGFLQSSQLVLVLLLPFMLMWSLGGFAAGSMVMLWALFTPIAALLLMEKRNAIRWFLAYAVFVIISVFIDDYLVAEITPIPELAIQIFYFLNISGVSAGLFLLVSYSINEEKIAIEKLKVAQNNVLAANENLERRVDKRTQELQCREADLRVAAAAFESQQGMMIADANCKIMKVNHALVMMTGYSAEEMVGQNISLFRPDHQDEEFFNAMWQSINETGGWQGEIWNRIKSGDIIPMWLTVSAVRDEGGHVTNHIAAYQDITERKDAEKKITSLAYYDQLTGLPNRSLLYDRLQQVLKTNSRSGIIGGLLFIDLDNFKNLNDSQGHDYGDRLLIQVANRFTQAVREGDTVARLGGDEFVIVLPEISTNEYESAKIVEAIAEKILALLNEPYDLNGYFHQASASIGVTMIEKESASIDELMKQADLAMYKSKDLGKNQIRFFDPVLEVSIKERAKWEADLRQALEMEHFTLHYQAQVDQSSKIIGVEVLSRWQHPERGIVMPGDFIPLAEETGLILTLGHWVLTTACRQLAIWADDPQMEHLSIAVNVSSLQFNQKDFVEKIMETIHETGANPYQLKLEITESVLIEDVRGMIEKMNTLKEVGIGFSLDDFGTGYSSLSYLRQLPLQQLKIDRSFVQNVESDNNNAAIAKTIIVLAQSLDLEVIAEGVETKEQYSFLQANGCNIYQGYLFSKPLPREEFEHMLVRGSR